MAETQAQTSTAPVEDFGPQSIRDRHGRTWLVEITVPAIKRVQSQTDFQLLSILDEDGRGVDQLTNDPVFLIEVLYAICEPQILEQGSTPEDFGSAFVGDGLRFAAAAILKALVPFYPNPDQRELLRRMIVILDGVQRKRTAATLGVLEKLNDEEAIDQVYEDLRRKAEEEAAGQTTNSSDSPIAQPDSPERG